MKAAFSRSEAIGKRFGKLVIKKFIGVVRRGHSQWLCDCDCGKETIVTDLCSFTSGKTKSCGCLKSEWCIKNKTTHGMAGSKTYRSWASMVDRCRREKSSKWSLYGARGIQVCKRWYKFENFLEDMGIKPNGLTLERIDSNGDYTPQNCRWASWREQANNHRTTIRIKHLGKIQSLADWCRELNVPRGMVYLRIHRRKWNPVKALTTPKLQ